MRHDRFLARAAGVALTSRHQKWHLGAILVRGGSILAASANVPRNSPHIDHRNATVHAEVATLRRVSDAHGCTLYVARVGRLGDVRLARPCAACFSTIRAAGVSLIVYSMGDYEMGMERLRDARWLR